MSGSSSISLNALSRGSNGIRGQTSHQTAIRRNSASSLGTGSNVNIPSSSATTDPGLVSSNSPAQSPSASQPGTQPLTPPPASTPVGVGRPTLTPDSSDQANPKHEEKEAWYRKAWTFINSFLNFTNVAITVSLGIIGILACRYQVQSQGLAVWNAKKDFQGSCLARKEAGELLSSECHNALKPDYLGEPPRKRDLHPPSATLYDNILSTKALLGLLNGVAEITTVGVLGIAVTGHLFVAFAKKSTSWDAVGLLCILAFWYIPFLPACRAYPLLTRVLFGPTIKAERNLMMLGCEILSAMIAYEKRAAHDGQRKSATTSFLRFYHGHPRGVRIAFLFFKFYAWGILGFVFLWILETVL